MLLVDGVRYELWNPPSEDEFEKIVSQHAAEIFGTRSLFLSRKQTLKSISGVGSIPDGYVIDWNESTCWHIVEIELSSHPLHEHVVAQVSKFINGIKNPAELITITNTFYSQITQDEYSVLKLKKANNYPDLHKLISDIVSKPPIVTIIIEQDTQELKEAIATLNHPKITTVDFKTYTREGAPTVHVHLFEPCYAQARSIQQSAQLNKEIYSISINKIKESPKKITVLDLINMKILKTGQVIFANYNGSDYQALITEDGKIKLEHNNKMFNSLSSAGVEITGYQVNGWIFWKAKGINGEMTIKDLVKNAN